MTKKSGNNTFGYEYETAIIITLYYLKGKWQGIGPNP